MPPVSVYHLYTLGFGEHICEQGWYNIIILKINL